MKKKTIALYIVEAIYVLSFAVCLILMWQADKNFAVITAAIVFSSVSIISALIWLVYDVKIGLKKVKRIMDIKHNNYVWSVLQDIVQVLCAVLIMLVWATLL